MRPAFNRGPAFNRENTVHCVFTNQIYFNTYMREAFIWGVYNGMIVFVHR